MKGGLIELYREFFNNLSSQGQVFLNLSILTIIVAAYGIFIWKFYTFISTRNILNLNLRKYNKSTHPVFAKLIAGILYLVEYLILIPLVIFFSFVLFTLFLVLITKGIETKNIILISAIIISAVRVTCYISKNGETIASEIAKIIPLTLLGLSVTNPSFFEFTGITTKFTELPALFGEIQLYLIFIVGIELIMRFLSFVFSIFKKREPQEEEQVSEEESS